MINYEQLYSNAVKDIKPSGIRKFFDIANEVKDAISLGVGEPDFPTPWQGAQGGIIAIEKGYTYYTSNWGLIELRREISDYFKNSFGLIYNSANEILVTSGSSEAIDNSIRAFVNVGDEVLIPEPSFVCYAPLVKLAGGIPVPIVAKNEEQFRITAKDLKAAITPKTKMLIMPYPNNPTGAIMERADLEKIADVLRRTDIIVLSDEIYAELNYAGKHVCFAEIEGMFDRTLTVSGFSKAFAMTGWRVGYVCGPAQMVAPICKIHQFAMMSAPTVGQMAAIECLKSCFPDVEHMREQYNIRRIFLVNELRRIGLPCFEPLGAFYIFPSIAKTGLNSEEFCERLLKEQKVAVVPGNAFGDCGEGFVRISYSYSMNHLIEAVKRMEKFMEQFK